MASPNPYFDVQFERARTAKGFIAALDQSGGSTPKALAAYGLGDDAYANESEMFDLVHAMRTRIMTNDAFTSEDIIAAILFEMTLARQVQGLPTAEYLWSKKSILPILKIDKGLADEANGVQLMKPIPGIEETLADAAAQGVFGTKMRSVIKESNADAIRAVVDQQFDFAETITRCGLVPIIEPEVDINAPDKDGCEAILLRELSEHLDTTSAALPVMFKLTLPNRANFYAPLIAHDRTLRVVALSGGYNREDANKMLSANRGVAASFSRALTEGLSAQQSDEEFSATLADSIASIAAASNT